MAAWDWVPPEWAATQPADLGMTPEEAAALAQGGPIPPVGGAPAPAGPSPAPALPADAFSAEEAAALAATGGAVPPAAAPAAAPAPGLPAGAFSAEEAAALAATGGAAPGTPPVPGGEALQPLGASPALALPSFPSASSVDAAAAAATSPGVPPPAGGAPPATAETTGAAPAGDPQQEPGAERPIADSEIEPLAVGLADMTPEEYLLAKDRRERGLRAKYAAEEDKATLKNLQQQRDNLQIYVKAQERADLQAEQLRLDASAASKMKVDPKRWYGNLETGDKLFALVAMVVGGLSAAANGGPNVGAQMIAREIDRDIDAQKENIANTRAGIDQRRGIVAEMMAANGDAYRSAEAARQASYQQVIDGLQDSMNAYDPNGTTAFRLAEQIRQLRAAQASAALKYRDEELERQLKAEEASFKRRKAAVDERQAAEQARANRVDEALRAQSNMTDAQRAETERLKAISELDKEKAAKDKAEVDEVRKFGVGGPAKLSTDAQGVTTVQEAGAPLRQKDGSVFKARKEEVANDLSQQMAGVGEAIDISHEIRAIRDRVGGESSLFNSDDLQRLKVLQSNLLKIVKASTHGMSSDSDMKVLLDSAGANDVASFRARAAGLEKAEERLASNLNRTLRANGYTGTTIAFPNRWNAPPPKQTTQEKKLESLLTKPSITPEEADAQATAIARSRVRNEKATLSEPNYGLGGGGKMGDDEAKQVLAMAKDLSANYKAITPKQMDGIDELAKNAATDKDALDDLKYVAAKGQTPEIRSYAENKLRTVTPASTAGPVKPAEVDEKEFQGALDIEVAEGDGKAAKRRFESLLNVAKRMGPEQRTAIAKRLRAKAKGDRLAADFQHALSTESRERILIELDR